MTVWEKRYQDGVFVEWYCGLDHVLPLFERFVPKDSRVLDVGCGDKPLAWDMRDAGYTGRITSFDLSPTVINKLVEESRSCARKRLHHGVEFRVLDARKLPFDAGSFDLVVDKGTVDAMLCDKTGKESARATCREAARVAAPGGWYIVVSHAHPSTAEGMEVLSETLVPALLESSYSTPVGRKGTKEGQEEDDDDGCRQDFFWSIDVHCGGGDGDDRGGGHEDDEGEGDADGGGGGDDEAGGECGGGEEDGRGGGDSRAGGQVGPSVYMARKMVKRPTRSSIARGHNKHAEKAVSIRIHEY
eukprot:g2435.t1